MSVHVGPSYGRPNGDEQEIDFNQVLSMLASGGIQQAASNNTRGDEQGNHEMRFDLSQILSMLSGQATSNNTRGNEQGPHEVHIDLNQVMSTIAQLIQASSVNASACDEEQEAPQMQNGSAFHIRLAATPSVESNNAQPTQCGPLVFRLELNPPA